MDEGWQIPQDRIPPAVVAESAALVVQGWPPSQALAWAALSELARACPTPPASVSGADYVGVVAGRLAQLAPHVQPSFDAYLATDPSPDEARDLDAYLAEIEGYVGILRRRLAARREQAAAVDVAT